MSEGASTMKLLEPRSLAGAERLASRAASPPMVRRSAAGGPTGFADRFFQSWLGGERPVSMATTRSPRSLAFPAPWYELPSDRHSLTRTAAQPAASRAKAPARVVLAPVAANDASTATRAPETTRDVSELRAIDLVLQSAPPMAPAAPFAPPSIAHRAVERLARVDELLRGVIHTPASTVELAALGVPGATSVASLPVGTLGAPLRSIGAPPALAFAPSPSAGARSLATAPTQGSSAPVSAFALANASEMPLVSRVLSPSPTSSIPSAAMRGIERTLLSPILVPALSASPVVAAAARASARAMTDATAQPAPLRTSSAATSTAPTSAASFAPGAASFAPGAASFAPGAASFAPGAASFAPGAASFAPGAASFASGAGSFAPGAASFAPGAASFAPGAASFSRSAAAMPTVAYAAPSAAPAVGVVPGLSMGPPVVWPRLQSFIERVAGPAMLGDAGFVLPSAAQAQSYTRVVDVTTGLAYVSLTSPTTAPSQDMSGDPRIARGLASASAPTRGGVAPLGASFGAHAGRTLSSSTSAPSLGTFVATPSLAPSPLTSRSLATPESTDAPFVVGARVSTPSTAPGAVPAAPSAGTTSGFAPSGFVSSASSPFAPSSFAPSSFAAPLTLAGELAQRAPAASYRPGRFAQRAELLATLAAARADRQLGTSVGVAQRSVQWSSDAFTVVALAPHSAAARAALPGLTRAPSSPATALSMPQASSYASPSPSPSPGALVTRATNPASFAPSYAFAPAPFASTPHGVAPAIGAATYSPDAVTARAVAPFERALVTPESVARSVAVAPASARGFTPFSSQKSQVPQSAQTAQASYVGPAALASGLPYSEAAAAAWAAQSAAPPTVRVAPLSIASVLAFADSQLGPRLLEGTRPLSVSVPAPVYLAPDDVAASPALRAQAERRAAPSRTFVAPGASPTLAVGAAAAGVSARAMDLGADFTLGAYGTLGYAPRQVATAQASAEQGSAIGQLGRRSEQLAGELGVRVGSLASDFLIDVQPSAESDAPGSTLHAATAGRAWLSTSDWILLSLFPSTTTAHQIAASSATLQGAARANGRFPLASTATSSLSSPALARSTVSAPEATPDALDAARAKASALAPALSSLVSPSTFSMSGDEHAPITAYLPDGRMPRGNRIVARTPALPMVAGAPSSSIATTVAATDRRTASPIGAPLWGHMRQLVEPGVQAPAPTAAAPVQGARATAMELVQPYIEAARQESSGSQSFMRQPTPTVSGSAPDASTKSLVRALSAQGSAPSNDRLSMADLTLISIVSATEQVAASGTGPSPDVAPADGRGEHHAEHATGAGYGGDVDHEIEVVAERAYERLMDELRRYNESKGETWEK